MDSDNSKIVTLETYQKALTWMLEAEDHMPQVFAAMSNGGQEQVLADLWYMGTKYVGKTGRGVPEAMMREFLMRAVQNVYVVNGLMQHLEAIKLFTYKIDPAINGKVYMPKAGKVVEKEMNA